MDSTRRKKRPERSSGDARVNRMVQLYSSGATLEAIGKEFDLTRERVRQILVRAGYDMSVLRVKAAKSRHRRMRREHGGAIHELLDKGLLPREVASALRLPVELVRGVDDANPEYARQRKLSRRRSSSSYLKYTDEDVLDSLRAASQGLGGVLTAAAYTEYSRGRRFPDGRPWPTHQTAFLRFGSWRAALEAAGLQSNPSSPMAGRQLFDEANCIDAILEVERAVGHLPSVNEYITYAAKMEGLLPSISTIRHRLGSWQGALRRAAEFASSYESDSSGNA